ncbi:hypothetical protein SODALDRAFT_331558 [Sodiomyces alkalinus F11]|uniref:Uncharacterized protein n=1 Tax=Sodiomyces alkalinus (strain CBS 110278 / VKM F-3762 / F11) TaxID=1314773 RepID=A0A3N2Q4R7_SODAK|nr:hypothetical protein SODALDRAFT_331558 [Sodiomyces alkalinus F11]ROT41773.1 hypothetical protein SODALDRAFT_331558 [Sodiomyces alkalinus F11]
MGGFFFFFVLFCFVCFVLLSQARLECFPPVLFTGYDGYGHVFFSLRGKNGPKDLGKQEVILFWNGKRPWGSFCHGRLEQEELC